MCESQFCGQPVRQGHLPLIRDFVTGSASKDEADRLYALYVEDLIRQQMEQERKKLYLIGSLRNEAVPALAARLRRSCPDTEIFDDWYAAGYEADDMWKSYEQARGRSYTEALEGYAARHVFEFDKSHLDSSSHVLLVLPAGKSGHMELMYGYYGAGCDAGILLEQGADPRWDVMYQFIPNIFTHTEEVEEWLRS